jgi:hypothetical protein
MFYELYTPKLYPGFFHGSSSRTFSIEKFENRCLRSKPAIFLASATMIGTAIPAMYIVDHGALYCDWHFFLVPLRSSSEFDVELYTHHTGIQL